MIKILMNMYRTPTVDQLIREEFAELERELYLEDKRADHHRARANTLRERMDKLTKNIEFATK